MYIDQNNDDFGRMEFRSSHVALEAEPGIIAGHRVNLRSFQPTYPNILIKHKDRSQHSELVLEAKDGTRQSETASPYVSGVFFKGTILPYISFENTNEGSNAMAKVLMACDVSASPGMLPTKYRLANPEDPVFSASTATIIFEADSYSASKLLEIGAFLLSREVISGDPNTPNSEAH